MSELPNSSRFTRRDLLHAITSLTKVVIFGGVCNIRSVRAEEPQLTGGYELGIYRSTGKVLIDGLPVTDKTVFCENSIIETFDDGELILILKHDVMLVRPNTRIHLKGASGTVRRIDLEFGGLYGVAEKQHDRRKLVVSTGNAQIDVYKASFYIEGNIDQDYVCVCHGLLRITAKSSHDKELIRSHVHDEPRYIYSQRSGGSLIRRAPMTSHSDHELGMLLSIQGKHLQHPSFLEMQGRVRRKLF